MAAALVSKMHGEGASPGEPGVDVVLSGAAALPDGNHAPRPLERGRPGSNVVFTVDDGTVLKLFRRIEAGPNPEIEMRSHLQRAGFAHTPALLAAFRGTLDTGRSGSSVWFGILQENVPSSWHSPFHGSKDKEWAPCVSPV